MKKKLMFLIVASIVNFNEAISMDDDDFGDIRFTGSEESNIKITEKEKKRIEEMAKKFNERNKYLDDSLLSEGNDIGAMNFDLFKPTEDCLPSNQVRNNKFNVRGGVVSYNNTDDDSREFVKKLSEDAIQKIDGKKNPNYFNIYSNKKPGKKSGFSKKEKESIQNAIIKKDIKERPDSIFNDENNNDEKTANNFKNNFLKRLEERKKKQTLKVDDIKKERKIKKRKKNDKMNRFLNKIKNSPLDMEKTSKKRKRKSEDAEKTNERSAKKIKYTKVKEKIKALIKEKNIKKKQLIKTLIENKVKKEHIDKKDIIKFSYLLIEEANKKVPDLEKKISDSNDNIDVTESDDDYSIHIDYTNEQEELVKKSKIKLEELNKLIKIKNKVKTIEDIKEKIQKKKDIKAKIIKELKKK